MESNRLQLKPFAQQKAYLIALCLLAKDVLAQADEGASTNDDGAGNEGAQANATPAMTIVDQVLNAL